jgi:DNA-binding response OmpR family regulator
MRILYADDDRDMASVVRMILERKGHQVTVALSGQEARSICADHVFDLWILDLALPGGHGGDLIRALRRMSDTRAIALIGCGTPHDVAECHDDGFDNYLAKPIDASQLLKAVSQTKFASRAEFAAVNSPQ